MGYARFQAETKPPSARISASAGRSELRPPSQPKTTVKKASVKQPEADKPKHVEGQPEAGNSTESASVLLPEIENLRWEWKKGGSFAEAWHCQAGTRGRSNSTYLGRIGRKQLEEFQTWPASEVVPFVTEWVQSKRDEKGIE
ncbi:MAG TPA: hypothetical protein VGB07_36265 [Blastocatellia bacterium]